MTSWPRQNRAAMDAYFGEPDADHNAVPDRAWEDENLVSIVPPYPMVLAWATDKPVKTIRIHKKVATSLQHVLAGIINHYGTHDAVRAARMHLYGGAYNFRLMRGGSMLSIHSWGAAIDLDPEVNAFGRRYDEHAGMMPPAVIALFAAEGWTWGGHWAKPDAMHMQAATI